MKAMLAPGLCLALALGGASPASTPEPLWPQFGGPDRNFHVSAPAVNGGRLVVLDEDGSLGLVRVSPDGHEVEARAEVFSSRSWTAPTLAGTRLFLRDPMAMVALDLS